jgi:hypothetical protein
MSSFFSGFKLQVDFNRPTFKMVGGMSIDDIKIKYIWFLNAEVIDAVIGEDENGLVWYSGDWMGGTWESGTWYSGTFHDGRWKKGNFYSYDIDQQEMLKGNLHINQVDITKSIFLSGSWEGGTFHYGIMGLTNEQITIPTNVDLNFVLNYNIDFKISGDTYYYYPIVNTLTPDGYRNLPILTYIKSPVFEGGEFINGWANAVKWQSGIFQNGILNNSIWYNGLFYNGYFLGDFWYNGSFFGGDFSNGTWYDGLFTSYKNNVPNRFGVNYKGDITKYINSTLYEQSNYQNTGATWKNGTFVNGEFHSTMNLDSNRNLLPSVNNSKVIWESGIFKNGTWYGGYINSVDVDSTIWENGTFLNGIINNITWNNGYIKDCLWIDGWFVDGTISGGMFENITFVSAEVGFDI